MYNVLYMCMNECTYVCIYVRMYVCMYVCTYTYVCMYVRMYVRLHSCYETRQVYIFFWRDEWFITWGNVAIFFPMDIFGCWGEASHSEDREDFFWGNSFKKRKVDCGQWKGHHDATTCFKFHHPVFVQGTMTRASKAIRQYSP